MTMVLHNDNILKFHSIINRKLNFNNGSEICAKNKIL